MSAEKALEGMLAEGVAPAEVLSKLEAEGFAITPPEGDASYEGGEGEPPSLEVLLMGGPVAPPEEGEEERPEPKGGDQSPFARRKSIAKKVMAKHGTSPKEGKEGEEAEEPEAEEDKSE
tara:strand:- start:121 stop:477 length:357 start_codon:yes stop_codon:yes gene_type:complete